MSDFQRSLFQKRIAQAEQQLGINLDDSADEEEDSLGELAPLPSFRDNRRPQPKVTDDAKYIASLPKWSDFYDSNDIYRDPESGYCFQTYYKAPGTTKYSVGEGLDHPVVFIGHHGAGSTGLTFAKLTESLKRQADLQGYDSSVGFFTFDMRGHAQTALLNSEDDLNMSIDQLEADFVLLLAEFYNKHFAKGSRPSLFLVGHSLGGAVLTKVVYEQQMGKQVLPLEIADCIKGLAMIDIVEDTAVQALGSMKSYLRGVPKRFVTLKNAIDWHLQSGLLNNRRSAVVSVPPLVEKLPDSTYRWVTDLAKTSPYWDKWFTGLSLHFTEISNAVSKLLILVNNDYLDKNLMIGQMQGRYQLLVFHNSRMDLKNTLTTATQTVNSEDADQLGHFVHEDIPDKVAISLLEFVERNDYNSLKRESQEESTQMDLLNKLNAKWGVKR